MLLGHHTSPALDRYHLEIKLRMMKCLLQTTLKPLTPIPDIHSSYHLQHILHVSDMQDDSEITNISGKPVLFTMQFCER